DQGAARRRQADVRRCLPARVPPAGGRAARHAMPRYKLILEYDGAPFRGWQRQSDGASVQQALEDAVRGFCGEEVQVVAAGRTDAGVHAMGQVAHLDLAREVTPETDRKSTRLNSSHVKIS